MNEYITLTGRYRIRIRQAGEVVKAYFGENLVVLTGHELVAGFLAGEGGDGLSHIALGTSGVSPALIQTTLAGTELARKAATVVRSGNEVKLTVDFAGEFADEITVAEVGVFNDPAGGVMFSRWVEGPFTLFPDQEMDLVWSVRVGR